MKDLVKNIKAVLKKEYYIREMVLLVVISLSLLCFGIYESLALFQTNLEKSSVATLIAGDINFALTSTNSKYNSSTGQITVDAGTTEELPLTITNNTTISAKYKLYYKSITPATLPEGVSINVSAESEENFDEGVLATNESVTRNISIENNSTSSVTLQFGVEKGYSHNELVLNENNNQLQSNIIKSDLVLNSQEDSNVISINAFEPIEREMVLTNATKKTFTVTNTSEEKKYVHLALDNMTLPDNLRRYDFVWSLYEGDKNVSNGTFLVDGNSVEIASYQVFEANEEKEYNLYIWVEETGLDQSIMIGQEFKATIKAKGEEYLPTPESDFNIYEDYFGNEIVNSFSYTGNDTNLIIPETINGLAAEFTGNDTFDPEYNRGIKLDSVVLPNTLISIGTNSFHNNNLTNIVIPNNVTDIAPGAFWNNKLTNVVIPNSVTYIDTEAFNSNLLKSVFIPNSVTTIGQFAFANNQLSNIIIPNSTCVQSDAFANNQLTSVVISEGVTEIWMGAFVNNPNLTEIIVLGKSEAPEGFGEDWNCKYYDEENGGCKEYYNVIYKP